MPKKKAKKAVKKENGFKCIRGEMTIYGYHFKDKAIEVSEDVAKRLSINSDFVQVVDGVEIGNS